MKGRKLRLIAVALVAALLMALHSVAPASADMPDLLEGTFPVDTYVIPMDTQQAALSPTDTKVYGFIWRVLQEGGVIHRIIQPPDSTLKTDVNPGGAVYSGGVILILPVHEAAVNTAKAAFPTVTVHELTEAFTSDKVFRVKEPTDILVIDGTWGDTDVDLDEMGVPYTMVSRTTVEADPAMLLNYNLVVVDCPGWDGAPPGDIVTALRGFAGDHGGELIFTDRALRDVEVVFPGYVTVVTNVDGVWDTNIHNPPITGFTPEYPTQYPSDLPTGVKIYTMIAGNIVESADQPDQVRVWMDSDDYGAPGVYRVLGFYFPYGDKQGIVEGMAYHPQEQRETGPPGPGTGDPNSFVAGTVFFGNKLVFAPPELRLTLDPPTDVNDVGEDHEVTATLTTEDGVPMPGETIDFEVIAGPHVGEMSDPGECSPNADCTTDANGEVSWSYRPLPSGWTPC